MTGYAPRACPARLLVTLVCAAGRRASNDALAASCGAATFLTTVKALQILCHLRKSFSRRVGSHPRRGREGLSASRGKGHRRRVQCRGSGKGLDRSGTRDTSGEMEALSRSGGTALP